MTGPAHARSGESSSPAFDRVLARVVSEERVTFALAIAWVRLVIATMLALFSLRVVFDEALRHLLFPTILAASVYLCLAVVLLVLIRRKILRTWAGWTVMLVEAPLVATTQAIQTWVFSQRLVDNGTLLGPVLVMTVVVVLSAFSLSRRVVVGTGLIGLASILFRGLHLHLHYFPVTLSVIFFSGNVALVALLITRILRLIHTSRERDLIGKYLLGPRLGAGGMAEVFEATYAPEGGFERKVAVKRILPSHADRPEVVELFRREAQVGALLAHPGVVQVLDFGLAQGNWFLAMEFVDGVSLRQLMQTLQGRGERLPLMVVTHLATQISDALDYVHNRTDHRGAPLNLVHRDLNPPNIMVTRSGDVKLADFGIALSAAHERLTATGLIRGKLAYAAPEQIAAGRSDARADLYALGITLHEALSGRRLFTADTELELLKKCLEAPVPVPSSLRDDVPPQLDTLIMGLLERDVARRTPTAAAVKRELFTWPATLVDPMAARSLLAHLVGLAQAEPSTAVVEIRANEVTAPAATGPGAVTI